MGTVKTSIGLKEKSIWVEVSTYYRPFNTFGKILVGLTTLTYFESMQGFFNVKVKVPDAYIVVGLVPTSPVTVTVYT